MAEADELRIRGIRSGNLRIALGLILGTGAWLLLPYGIYQLATGSAITVPVIEAVAGVALLAAGVLTLVGGARARRRAASVHAPVTAAGRANPAFGEDRQPLPTGGVPINWIGGVPGS
jgi:hypothetical protein